MKHPMQAAIIIPAYKPLSRLTADELKSLEQCFWVLANYDIYLLVPASLDTVPYSSLIKENHGKELRITKFNDTYFSDIAGYNRLMLNPELYQTYAAYKYMLIYQLDCWVFKDELDYWCQQNYDYIGAPIFENFGTAEQGNQMQVVGNGGFSLRKTSKFLTVLTWRLPIRTLSGFTQDFRERKSLKNLLRVLLGVFGYHNTVGYLLRFYKQNNINEDLFFSYNFTADSWLQIRVPALKDAVRFAFDRSPQYLYTINNHQLPFGCHGWNRSDDVYLQKDKSFWSAFIN
jgi:hypothetical protein